MSLPNDEAKVEFLQKFLQSETGLSKAIVEAWDGLIYVGTPDLRIKYLNRRFIDLLGRDATGEHCFRALHGREEACPWCPREVFQGQTVRGRFRKPADGRWYDVLNTPLPLSDGTFWKIAFIRESTDPDPAAMDLPVFQNIVDRLSDAVFLLAPEDGRVLYANDTACAYLGYHREELLEMRASEFASLEDSGETLSRVQTGVAPVQETRHRRRDGSLLDVEVKTASARAGLEPFIVMVARDITERKKTEALLIEERNKIEATMSALGDGITVLDRDFRVIYQNETHLRWRGSHLGEYCYSAFQQRKGICDDCQAEKSFADGLIYRRQAMAPGPLGPRDLEVTSCPLRNAAGDIVACVEVVRDITEQKRMEQEIRESNEKYRLLFSAESEAILTLDAVSGEIQEVNDAACRVYDRNRDEFASCRWSDLVAETGEETSGRLRTAVHLRGDGSRFPVEFSTGTFLWQGRSMMVAVVRDITERQRLEEAREELFSLVSHEMRTPLTAILGFSEFLLKNDAAPEQRKEFLNLVMEESQRLQVLIENLLGLQRLRAGFGLEDPVPVRLPALLRKTAKSFRNPLCQRKIAIDCTGDLPPVFGDPTRIEQAVNNLLGNAVKYSPAGSTILLGARADGGYALLWVRDQGPGIARDQQEKIFERFYRANGCKGPSGTGLGLALVREVAQAHGGRTWVESSPGQGSTFYLTLPFAT